MVDAILITYNRETFRSTLILSAITFLVNKIIFVNQGGGRLCENFLLCNYQYFSIKNFIKRHGLPRFKAKHGLRSGRD
jgi:hypothetical protein